jgi:transposase
MTPLNLASSLAGAHIYMALSPVDMRKGFDGLAMVVQDVLKKDPFAGAPARVHLPLELRIAGCMHQR